MTQPIVEFVQEEDKRGHLLLLLQLFPPLSPSSLVRLPVEAPSLPPPPPPPPRLPSCPPPLLPLPSSPSPPPPPLLPLPSSPSPPPPPLLPLPSSFVRPITAPPHCCCSLQPIPHLVASSHPKGNSSSNATFRLLLLLLGITSLHP